jgi:hypothetical protein
MLAANDLQRSISKMTLSLARDVDAHRHRADLYRLCERENQFQFRLFGEAGSLPAETLLGTPAKPFIPFDVMFVAHPGNQRDSQVTTPQVRLGYEITQGPPGLISYAHVTQWQRDGNGNYIGAQVVAGVYAPALVNDVSPFKVVLHIAFQGYGTPIDPQTSNGAG